MRMQNPKSEYRSANQGRPLIALTLLLLSTLGQQLSTARAQQYSIDWYKIAGGGGTSTGGTYTSAAPSASTTRAGR